MLYLVVKESNCAEDDYYEMLARVKRGDYVKNTDYSITPVEWAYGMQRWHEIMKNFA